MEELLHIVRLRRSAINSCSKEFQICPLFLSVRPQRIFLSWLFFYTLFTRRQNIYRKCVRSIAHRFFQIHLTDYNTSNKTTQFFFRLLCGEKISETAKSKVSSQISPVATPGILLSAPLPDKSADFRGSIAVWMGNMGYLYQNSGL